MPGTGEMLLIALVAILVVDPKKLPDLMKSVGKAIGDFKQMSGEFKRTIERETEMADFERRKAEAEEHLFGNKDSASTPAAEPETQPSTETASGGEAKPAAEPSSEPETQPADETVAGSAAEPQDAPDLSGLPGQPPVERAGAEEAPAEPAQGDAAPVEPAQAPAAEAAPGAEAAAPMPPAEAAEPMPPAEVAEPMPPAEAAEPMPPAEAAESMPPAEAQPAAAPAGAGDDVPPPPPPKGDDAVGEGEAGRMSLFGHLNDLRKRLTRSAIAVLVGFLGCYAFAQKILTVLMQPMLDAIKQSHFIYTLPTEAFFTEMKVAFVAGMFVSSPYIFYQIWQFIAPGLYSHERKWIMPIAFFSALCFTCGALFGYFVVFPFGFEFFASYSNDLLVFTPKLDEYLDFVLKLLFAFGIVFELPLFLFFLARLGLVTHEGLKKKRKYAILAAFILAAALTPPDAISQTMMAVPLCVLYEVGVWLAFFFGKKRKPAQQEDETPPAAA